MANDFSGDTNCKALWRFENGALTTDTIGTNTLSASATPVADLVTFKEGAASCDFEAGDSDYLSISDANLDAGFPLKNGDAVGTISTCFWVKFESLPFLSSQYLIEKGTSSKCSFAVAITNVSGTNYRFILLIGRNAGANYQQFTHDSQVAVDTWYHVGVSYNNSDKSYRVHIWDDTAGATLGSDLTGNSTDNINIEDAGWYIGTFHASGLYADGLIDEMVVFADVLSAVEMDSVRAGTYAGSTTLSLAGTVAATSSVSGAIGTTTITPLSLAGSIAAVSFVSGSILSATLLSLSGIIAAVSSVSAVLSKTVLLLTFPPARADDYDEDLVWDEDTGTWGSDKDLLQAGGSKYRSQLIVIAKDLIYYEEVT